MNPNRKKIEELLKKAQKDFPFESVAFEVG